MAFARCVFLPPEPSPFPRLRAISLFHELLLLLLEPLPLLFRDWLPFRSRFLRSLLRLDFEPLRSSSPRPLLARNPPLFQFASTAKFLGVAFCRLFDVEYFLGGVTFRRLLDVEYVFGGVVFRRLFDVEYSLGGDSLRCDVNCFANAIRPALARCSRLLVEPVSSVVFIHCEAFQPDETTISRSLRWKGRPWKSCCHRQMALSTASLVVEQSNETLYCG